MAYKKGSEKVYFPGVVALLAAIAAFVGMIVYQALMGSTVGYEEILEEETGEVMGVNPTGLKPTAAPTFPGPPGEPPSN